MITQTPLKIILILTADAEGAEDIFCMAERYRQTKNRFSEIRAGKYSGSVSPGISSLIQNRRLPIGSEKDLTLRSLRLSGKSDLEKGSSY